MHNKKEARKELINVLPSWESVVTRVELLKGILGICVGLEGREPSLLCIGIAYLIAGSEITINVPSSDYTYIILYSLLLHK